MRRALGVLVVLGMAVTATACDREGRQDAASGDPLQAPPEVQRTAPPGAVQDAHRAELDEWTVRLERDRIPAGSATFLVTNRGEYQHALEIEGAGREWETDRLGTGDEERLTADLEPGTYEVYCPIVDEHGSHRERGMTTTLVVE